jgi:hypothetical protein
MPGPIFGRHLPELGARKGRGKLIAYAPRGWGRVIQLANLLKARKVRSRTIELGTRAQYAAAVWPWFRW